MGEFFKTFGQGILYVLLSPILIIVFALYLVYALIVYLVMEVASIFYFFSGRNISDDDYETKQLIAIKSKKSVNNLQPVEPIAVIKETPSDDLEDIEEKEEV